MALSFKKPLAFFVALALLLGEPGLFAVQAAAQNFTGVQASNGASTTYNPGLSAARTGLAGGRLPATVNFNVTPIGSLSAPWTQGLTNSLASGQNSAAPAAAAQSAAATLPQSPWTPEAAALAQGTAENPAFASPAGFTRPLLQRLKAELSSQEGSGSDASAAASQLPALNARIALAGGANALAAGRIFNAFYDNLLDNSEGVSAQIQAAYSLARSRLEASSLSAKAAPYLSAAPPAPRPNGALALPGPLLAAGIPFSSMIPSLGSPPEPILFLKAGLLTLVAMTPVYLVRIYRDQRQRAVREYADLRAALSGFAAADLKSRIAQLEKRHPFLAELPEGTVAAYRYHRSEAERFASDLYAQRHFNPMVPLEALKVTQDKMQRHEGEAAKLEAEYPALASRPLLYRAISLLAQAAGYAAFIAGGLAGGGALYSYAVASAGASAFLLPLAGIAVGAALLLAGTLLIDGNPRDLLAWLGRMLAAAGASIILSSLIFRP